MATSGDALIAKTSEQQDFLYSALCCSFNACSKDIAICVAAEQELCCLTSGVCIEASTAQYPIGLMDASAYKLVGNNGHCCALALPCCFIGLKQPEVLCNGGQHILCFKQRTQLPCRGDGIPEAVCAICCIQLLPNVGVCVAPPTILSFK